MNNRNLLITAFGLFAMVSAYAEVEDISNVNVSEEVIHEELSDWKNDSKEASLIRNDKAGFVQGQKVEEAFDRLLSRTNDDTVWLSYIEPFLFEGKEFGDSADYVGGSNETVLN